MEYKKICIVITSALMTFFIGKTFLLSNELKETKQSLINMEQKYNEATHKQSDDLSEWDIFTLALMKVESNYEATAVSSVGAKGYFQITPIYVEEVNRIHKTNYKFEEVVKSFDMSYEVFTLMQKAHNKEFNMDEALRLHNGDHEWYRKRVYNEMSAIKTYEKMRQMLKK